MAAVQQDCWPCVCQIAQDNGYKVKGCASRQIKSEWSFNPLLDLYYTPLIWFVIVNPLLDLLLLIYFVYLKSLNFLFNKVGLTIKSEISFSYNNDFIIFES